MVLKNKVIYRVVLLVALLQVDSVLAATFLATVTGEEAVQAAEEYTGRGKVLSTNQATSEQGRDVYRVKILMPSGVLRTVVVDAETGNVVE